MSRQCPRCSKGGERLPYYTPLNGSSDEIKHMKPGEHFAKVIRFGQTETGETVYICLECGGRSTESGTVLSRDVSVYDDDRYSFRRHSRGGAE